MPNLQMMLSGRIYKRHKGIILTWPESKYEYYVGVRR